MPVPTPETFKKMIQSALREGYALASINVTSSSTANAAMAAFAESKSDGIVQISTGGGEFASGPAKNMAVGAIALAEYVHRIADELPVNIALTTDHCVPGKVSSFLVPLIEESERRKAVNLPPLFNGHMFDGSELALDENLTIAQGLLKRCAALDIVLEVEIGVVGGEEDGIDNSKVGRDRLYTSPQDMLKAYEALHPHGFFTLAAAFGNVHGVYKPGNVVLRPSVLRDGNALVIERHGATSKMPLVFHGGSGSDLSDIHAAIDYGVVKMNVDTDCQYAYTRAAADHMLSKYAQVLRVDGEMGDKKQYDPRTWSKLSEASMKQRVLQACSELRSVGQSVYLEARTKVAGA